MANGFDYSRQGYPDYGNYGDNAVFNSPWLTDADAAANPWLNSTGLAGGTPWINPDPYVESGAQSWGDFFNSFDFGNSSVPSYNNPFWGPLNTPAQVQIGDPSMQIPDSGGPGVIGGDLAYDVGQNSAGPVGHGSLGANNPTVYGRGSGGGLFGSGLDVGIPGLVSLGGLMGAGGGLLGLGGDMGSIFGGGGGGGSGTGSGMGPNVDGAPLVTLPTAVFGQPDEPVQPEAPVDTPPQTPVTIPPVISAPTNTTPQQPVDAPQTPVTVPPVITPPANTAPDSNPVNEPLTVIGPPGTPQGPVQGETPTNPTTIPVIPGSTTTPTDIPITNPTTIPVIPVTPPAGGGGGGGSGTPPTTNPTTMPALPLDRNLFREGTQTNQDLASILQGIFGNYAGQAGQYGQQDLNNFGGVLGGVLGNNSTLTGAANAQTATSNTALRTGNVNDAQNLGGQALATLRNLNPNMYGALDQAQMQSQRGPSDIQRTLEQQARSGLALGGSLSSEENRAAQQSAREAWGARGLVNSNGAIGAEILSRDSLSRQRQQERQQFAQSVDAAGFGQRQTGYGNTLSNAALQSQYGFNPFQTITSANTQNQGMNQNLFGNTAGFSSGAYGNQNAQELANPFGTYAQDVYSTNYNAGNDRYIAAGNNAAGLAGASSAAQGALANSFIKALGSYLGSTCWVARSIFGETNPKWLQFREWLLNYGPKWFLKLYMKHGEKFALWLDKNPWLKPAIRMWMESRIRSMNTLNPQLA